MSPNKPFPEALADWLICQDNRYDMAQLPAEIGIWLRVEMNGSSTLEILAVELNKWVAAGNLEAWKQYVQTVRKKRHDGLKCVIIWENDWWSKQEIVKSRINAMLGRSQRISARLTQVTRIDRQTCLHFFQKNHLNWALAGKYRYALWLPNRYYRTLPSDFAMDRESKKLLVAVATFSHARVFLRSEKPFRSSEMLRFANRAGTHVTGGLTRLISTFVRERAPDDVMTYADLEWSEGEGYRQAGFEAISETDLIDFEIDTENMDRVTRKEAWSDRHIQAWNAGSIKYVKPTADDVC